MYGADITISYTTKAEYQTTMKTQRYNGSEWIETPIRSTLTDDTKFTT